jgi:hypothetical protein
MEREKCVICERLLPTQEMYNLDETYICGLCVDENDGRGKYEAYLHDYDALAKALILRCWSHMSSEDDYMSSEGWGYCGRFGRFLLYEDTRGFVTFDEFSTDWSAKEEFARLYDQGWGASEDDAFISSHNGHWHVQFGSEELNVWGRGKYGHPIVLHEGIDERRCVARVRLEAMKTGYYPNLWIESDHGNLQLISY